MYIPGNNEKDPTRVTSAIRELATGRSNAVGTVASDGFLHDDRG
jgi:hypothetical protein